MTELNIVGTIISSDIVGNFPKDAQFAHCGHVSGLFHKGSVRTNTFMKEKRGFKRKLLGTRYDGWRNQTVYTWQYIWSDGTKSISYTYR